MVPIASYHLRHEISLEARDIPNATARIWVISACRPWERGVFLLGMMKSSRVMAASELMPELTVLLKCEQKK